MPRYEVYVTRNDSAGVIDEIPARGLSFSLPVNDHGECTFTATVPPSGPSWRPAVALPFSGVLVARDGVPWWQGAIVDERAVGPRTFQFTAREWGWVFEEEIPAVPRIWNDINDHVIFRQLISDAQAISGQNYLIEMGSSLGAATSRRVVNWWDKTTVGREFRSIGDAATGPDWYFPTAGTLDAPKRQLFLADRAGLTVAETVLEYVEDTETYTPDSLPVVSLLGDLYPGPAPVVPVRRAGGNVIAQARTRGRSEAATAVIATGDGQEAAQVREAATASNLLAQGWPRITRFSDYTDVSIRATLARHAKADLAASAGIATGYSLVTMDDDPSADWTATPRGSQVRVVLDTDVYGADRPVGGPDGFEARCVNTVIRVPESGTAQVEWQVVNTLEVS